MSQCKHRILHIEGFNVLGVTVECTGCHCVFDIPDEAVNEVFYSFTHTSPKGPESDIQVLIHQEVVDR